MVTKSLRPVTRETSAVVRDKGPRAVIVTVVGGFATAISLARSSDLVATVPERHTRGLRDGLISFALPVSVPEFSVSLLWHPRMEADPAHRWLRARVREVCADQEA